MTPEKPQKKNKNKNKINGKKEKEWKGWGKRTSGLDGTDLGPISLSS